MRLDYHSAESLAPVIEALLFASDEPLSAEDLRALILGEELERPEQLPLAETPSQDEVAQVAVDAEPAMAVSAVNEDAPVAAGPPSEKKRKRKSPIELPTIHAAVELLNQVYEGSSR